ncbi:MAG: tetratricopeptide repeat protein [Planctomycetota bacterium]
MSARALAAALGVSFLALTGIRAQSADHLLQEGLYLETVQGNLPSAIEKYRAVLASRSASTRTAAEAHLHLGFCYRLQGNLNAALEQFRTLAGLYRSEPAARLGRKFLGKYERLDPALFMPPDALFFAELSEPSDWIPILVEGVRGTPFENPVDTLRSRASIPSGLPDGVRLPREVRGTAAFLNQGFFREMQKTHGLAISALHEAGSITGFLAVLFPGESDVLRGLFQGAASAFAHDVIRQFIVFQWSKERLFIAVGEGTVLISNRREDLVAAIDRFREKGPSLSTEADFRVSQAQRNGALFFAYLGRSWSQSIAERLSGSELSLYEKISGLLQWSELYPLALRVARDPEPDLLEFSLHSWQPSRAESDLRLALRTPRIAGSLVGLLPKKYLAAVNLSLSGATKRATAMLSALETVRDVTPESESEEIRQGIEAIRRALDAPGTSTFVENVGEILVAAVPSLAFPGPASFLVAFEFQDEDAGTKSVRKLLSTVLKEVFKTPASEDFRTRKDPKTGVEIHYVEPIPDLRFGYFADAGRVLVALQPGRFLQFERATNLLPPDVEACKTLSVKPRKIFQTLGLDDDRSSSVFQILVREIDALTLHTVENPKSTSLVLRIPAVTTTMRRALNSLVKAALRNNKQDD